MSTTGDRLKQRRKELGLSADEVAAELGISRSTIFRYESGFIEKVPANVIETLADILLTTRAYLMGWEDDPEDWERVGNDLGIAIPNDYDGDPSKDYKKFVKYKVLEEAEVAMREISDSKSEYSTISVPGILSKEQNLLASFRKLNDTGKEKAMEYVEDLKDNPKYSLDQLNAPSTLMAAHNDNATDPEEQTKVHRDLDMLRKLGENHS